LIIALQAMYTPFYAFKSAKKINFKRLLKLKGDYENEVQFYVQSSSLNFTFQKF